MPSGKIRPSTGRKKCRMPPDFRLRGELLIASCLRFIWLGWRAVGRFESVRSYTLPSCHTRAPRRLARAKCSGNNSHHCALTGNKPHSCFSCHQHRLDPASIVLGVPLTEERSLRRQGRPAGPRQCGLLFTPFTRRIQSLPKGQTPLFSKLIDCCKRLFPAAPCVCGVPRLVIHKMPRVGQNLPDKEFHRVAVSIFLVWFATRHLFEAGL